MLQPKKTKFRREQKNRMKGMSQRGSQLAFGSFGLKTLENCWLTSQQIEAARQAISRYMNREGQIWIRVFPAKPFKRGYAPCSSQAPYRYEVYRPQGLCRIV